MVQLLTSWGVQPSAVTGHSSGEIAAVFAAGYISFAEAITAAYYRGYVVGKHTMDGAMKLLLLLVSGKIRVACVKSPESVTISGDAPAIGILLEALKL
jgi:acyl transferase domain-containing protein